MKHIRFEESDGQLYVTLYDGINNSSRPLSVVETRVMSKVLDKIEAIGKLAESNGAPMHYSIAQGGGCLKLEVPEYKLMMDVLKGVQWLPRGARNAAALMDKVEDAKDDGTGCCDD